MATITKGSFNKNNKNTVEKEAPAGTNGDMIRRGTNEDLASFIQCPYAEEDVYKKSRRNHVFRVKKNG